MSQRRDTLKDLLYSDLLQPSPGFEVDFAIGVTYSLSFEGLLSVPMAFGMLGEFDETIRQSPAYLLESIRRGSDRFILFCNKGGIQVPQNSQTIYSLFESSIQEVVDNDKMTANFHPKMWVIREINDNNEEQIRLLILSRNLTYSDDIDVIVSMRGRLLSEGRRSKNARRHQPLQWFLTNLADQLPAGDKKQQVLRMADDILRIERFDMDEPFIDDAYDFFPVWFGHQAPDTPSLKDILARSERLMIVSPFVDTAILQHLAARRIKDSYKVLVTRSENISQEVLDTFDEVYAVNDTMLDNTVTPVNLHAKLYLTQCWTGDRRGHFLYLGSANATNNAFHRNTEMTVAFQFRQTRGERFFAMRDEILGNENRYVRITEPTAIDTTEQRQRELGLEHALKYAMRAIKSATITPGKTDELYDISLATTQKYIQQAKRELKRELTDFGITLRPLQCDQTIPWDKEMRLTDIYRLHLSEFYVLEIRDGELSKRALCKVPTNGMPAMRDNWIYQSVVDTREKFMNYAALMFSDDPVEMLSMQDFLASENGGSSSAQQAQNYPQIYEQLLRVAYSSPRMLRDVNELVNRLGANVVPQDFAQMLDKFTSIIKQLERLC
ncbi:MAG: phospholipase D family protein [Paludibacteraceae bacterium]|nr:phospholipase D family protein [Paludibacteraceae bacterium]